MSQTPRSQEAKPDPDLDPATYASILDSALNAFVLVDRDGRIVYANALAESWFGYRPAELVGQPIEVLVPERLRRRHEDDRRAFLGHPAQRPMGGGRDLLGRRKDGSEFPVEIGLNPIPTAGGVLVLSAIVDITERKRVEERLRHTAAELARSNTELEQFAYVASHDLQEPIRMIASFLELLEAKYRSRLDADADRYIHYAVDGAHRLHAMVDGLLTFSRAGRDVALGPVAADQALAAALANLGRALAESGARVVADPLPPVRSQLTQLTQVFQNLIENAIKYRGAEPPLVRISAQRVGEQWRLAVADNGVGVPEGGRERIFQIFQRLHDREHSPGSGIGLAVARRIVERHGGSLWVEPDPGGGSVFIFTLGVADARLPP